MNAADEEDDGEVITFLGGFRPEFVNRAAEHLRNQGNGPVGQQRLSCPYRDRRWRL
jgi:hypothetical protein